MTRQTTSTTRAWPKITRSEGTYSIASGATCTENLPKFLKPIKASVQLAPKPLKGRDSAGVNDANRSAVEAHIFEPQPLLPSLSLQFGNAAFQLRVAQTKVADQAPFRRNVEG